MADDADRDAIAAGPEDMSKDQEAGAGYTSGGRGHLDGNFDGQTFCDMVVRRQQQAPAAHIQRDPVSFLD